MSPALLFFLSSTLPVFTILTAITYPEREESDMLSSAIIGQLADDMADRHGGDRWRKKLLDIKRSTCTWCYLPRAHFLPRHDSKGRDDISSIVQTEYWISFTTLSKEALMKQIKRNHDTVFHLTSHICLQRMLLDFVSVAKIIFSLSSFIVVLRTVVGCNLFLFLVVIFEMYPSR